MKKFIFIIIATLIISPKNANSLARCKPIRRKGQKRSSGGLQSDYPVTWEQSVGDLGAISGAGGIGDTLGGLTAIGVKISWERCGEGQCPITWILSLKNNTQDLVSTAPSLGIFTNHTPIVSDSRPTTVLPGGTALLVYSFPEFKDSLTTSGRETWQWNWYLAQLR